MNIIAFILAALVSNVQPVDESFNTIHGINDEHMCITAERIVKPSRNWKVIKQEIKYQDKVPFMEVSAHNPLNKKTPDSVDVKFVLAIDPVTPSDVQKYNLVMAVYYNEKSTVTFRRIYSLQEVTVKNKVKKFPMQTPCFAREIMRIIQLEPEIIKIQVPDGGVK